MKDRALAYRILIDKPEFVPDRVDDRFKSTVTSARSIFNRHFALEKFRNDRLDIALFASELDSSTVPGRLNPSERHIYRPYIFSYRNDGDSFPKRDFVTSVSVRKRKDRHLSPERHRARTT